MAHSRSHGPSSSWRRDLGERGEEAVVQWYEANGFSVVARNWRSRSGEIDLVARKGDLVVICEVKTRTSSKFGSPLESVTAEKAHRLRRLGAEWLAATRRSGGLSGADGRGIDVRFDVASVMLERGQLVVEVLEAAF